jgi:hypothetical protein
MKVKKTRETMMLEPLPIFDCIYCIKDHHLAFKKILDDQLTTKYDGYNTN